MNIDELVSLAVKNKEILILKTDIKYSNLVKEGKWWSWNLKELKWDLIGTGKLPTDYSYLAEAFFINEGTLVYFYFPKAKQCGLRDLCINDIKSISILDTFISENKVNSDFDAYLETEKIFITSSRKKFVEIPFKIFNTDETTYISRLIFHYVVDYKNRLNCDVNDLKKKIEAKNKNFRNYGKFY